MPVHETKVSSVVVGTCAVPLRSSTWTAQVGLLSVGAEDVSKPIHDTGCDTGFGCTRQVCTSVGSLTLSFKFTPRTFSVYTVNAPNLWDLLLLLPNLEILEVLTGYSLNLRIAEDSSESAKLPQVRMLVVDSLYTYPLLKSCPNAKRVVIHGQSQDSDSRYLKSIPFIADSLANLALCFPHPQDIRGTGSFILCLLGV